MEVEMYPLLDVTKLYSSRTKIFLRSICSLSYKKCQKLFIYCKLINDAYRIKLSKAQMPV